MNGPLHGVRIVELATVLSGPLATALLADQGAEVIKVEALAGDTVRRVGPALGDQSAMFVAANRGKRLLALDLKTPAARAVLHRLLDRADVLVENFRPGVMARLGLGDAELAARWPALVRVSVTGFGEDGPRAGDKAYDAVIQALSGLAASHPDRHTGEPDLLPTLVCDKLTALTAAQAITAALLARARDGRGRRVQLSMLDATLAFQWPDAMYKHVFVDHAHAHADFPEIGASTRPWRSADGHVATMSPQQEEFAAICRCLGRPEIADDPRFSSSAKRMRHGAELRALLAPLMAEWSTAELEARARAEHAPLGAVQSRAEVIDDPQVRHAASLVTLDNPDTGPVRLARSAALFDGQPQNPRAGGGRVGADSRRVLQEAGYSADEIDALGRSGVVGLGPPPALA